MKFYNTLKETTVIAVKNDFLNIINSSLQKVLLF